MDPQLAKLYLILWGVQQIHVISSWLGYVAWSKPDVQLECWNRRNSCYVRLWKNQSIYENEWASLVAQMIIYLQWRRSRFKSLGQEDPLEKEMTTHSSILAWGIPWMEEPGGLHSMGSQRVEHDWATNAFTFMKMSSKCVLTVASHLSVLG